MKVLVLGSGAREHAVTWKYARSKRISGLFIAPGNAGTAELGTNLPDVDPEKLDQVIGACETHGIDHVFVGPEAPLAKGIVDGLKERGIPAIGPHLDAARLESSKTFSKQFMLRHKIPTAGAREFSDAGAFSEYIKSLSGRVVIKKSGLAAGKGVLESDDQNELLAFGRDILKNDSLLVEDFLEGYEISIFAFTDGKDYIILPTCADFKKAGEGDTGPNTGGMGAVCPVPVVQPAMMERIIEEVVVPTFRGMEEENLSYQGILYFGLMICPKGPYLLEYNTRLGDPEAQVLLPLIESDFGNLTEAMLEQKLLSFPLKISSQSALGVVVASGGYPGNYKKNIKVAPLPAYPEEQVLVFHAATKTDKDGHILTGGGRCFTVVGLGKNTLTASSRAYEAVPKVAFSGAWFRKDIGKKFFMD